jgi:hypothetical protein
MSTVTGVFPVFNNVFQIGTAGEASEETDMKTIAEMETFSVKMDGKVQEWTPMTAEGWTSRLMTGKGFTITLSGKRYIGDAGNDYVAGLAWASGRTCSSKFKWTFPSGGTLEFGCVVNVTTPGGGDSTDVDSLEFDVMSNGLPVYTAPPTGA